MRDLSEIKRLGNLDQRTRIELDTGLPLTDFPARQWQRSMVKLDQQPRMAGAVCRRPTRLIRLRGADLDELMAQRPQAMREIIRVLVQRLRATSQRMSAS